MKRLIRLILCAALPVFFGLAGAGQAAGLVAATEFGADNEIIVQFNTPVDPAEATDTQSYTVYEETDPDIRLTVSEASLSTDGRQATLSFAEPLNTSVAHVVTLHDVGGVAETSFSVSKPYLGYLFSILISALLINNFVFTKYLGLCVFFGTSKRKQTAKGMGVVFTIVIVVAVSMSWVLFQYVLKPFNLDYLQIVIFIGLTSLTVQAVDTVLRKVNPILFKSFGVYLVLVIANCVIIAVPLLMASNEYNYFETFMLSLGAGGGFLLALYLMSSVSERLELARVPASFKGLPIAFIVAGQFAMAFLGFSGLQLF
ncbi:MAG: Rnf-Nqr domain containing protein [Desulfofustis sp.]|jgi:electron transport complex protein RnfA|nr:Rnf-Nqr domain containing protein [Desulfofustis sp.]